MPDMIIIFSMQNNSSLLKLEMVIDLSVIYNFWLFK